MRPAPADALWWSFLLLGGNRPTPSFLLLEDGPQTCRGHTWRQFVDIGKVQERSTQVQRGDGSLKDGTRLDSRPIYLPQYDAANYCVPNPFYDPTSNNPYRINPTLSVNLNAERLKNLPAQLTMAPCSWETFLERVPFIEAARKTRKASADSKNATAAETKAANAPSAAVQDSVSAPTHLVPPLAFTGKRSRPHKGIKMSKEADERAEKAARDALDGGQSAASAAIAAARARGRGSGGPSQKTEKSSGGKKWW